MLAGGKPHREIGELPWIPCASPAGGA